jgi:hypothetical protein
MIKKILKYTILSILSIIVVFIIGVKLFLSEFSEFKTIPIIEDRKYISTDGPYVLHDKESIRIINIENRKHISDIEYPQNSTPTEIPVNIYNYGKKDIVSFTVELIDSLKVPKSEYDQPEKIFAVSDIEGNFYAFSKLLKSNNIIDKDFNWTFNDGHLVLDGDFVDRGLNVTQCLWLIYKLEKQATQYGGEVHFIMGNHETMNLSGKSKNIRTKYKKIAKKLNLDYTTDLIGVNSELGRWLRTKNVIEKIGNNLFVHGGISPELLNTKLTIDEINHIARASYGLPDSEMDKITQLIYSTNGPLWYRKNIRGISKNIQAEVDKAKSYFNVERIIIGHSTMTDIQGEHNNAIFDIDVHFPHKNKDISRGKGLLIKLNNVSKLDDNGLKTVLVK